MNSKGFTLLEVVIAILFLSVIALAAVPAFYAQFHMMNKSKDITVDAFANQREIERAINVGRNNIIEKDTNVNPTGEIELFGKKAVLSSVEVDIGNGEMQTVYLSKTFTKGSARQEPKVDDVKVEISTDPTDLTVDVNANSIVKGTYAVVEGDSLYYLGIYSWYVSRVGIANPLFPVDYKLVNSGVFLNNYEEYQNRYAVFTVTPVDAYGVRGREIPSQKVYIRGEDWKDGDFPWLDMNGNGVYDEGVDVKIPIHKLVDGFDTKGVLFDEDLNEIPIAGGALYIPRNIDLMIDNDKELDWAICKDINLATDIKVENGSDLNIISREGNITLYNTTPNGGVDIETEGNITLSTEGRGIVNIQNSSTLVAGESLTISPKGRFNMWGSSLKASNIIIDSSRSPIITGNRSIQIEDSVLELNNNSDEISGNITILTPNNFTMSEGTIRDVGNVKGQLILSVDGTTTLPSNIHIKLPE